MKREDKLVKLEFIANGGSIIIEFNGKRYAFSTNFRVKIIPEEAYINAILSQHINIQHLRHYTTEADQRALRAELEVKTPNPADEVKRWQEAANAGGQMGNENATAGEQGSGEGQNEGDGGNQGSGSAESAQGLSKGELTDLVLKEIKSAKTKEDLEKIVAPEHLTHKMKKRILKALNARYAELENAE